MPDHTPGPWELHRTIDGEDDEIFLVFIPHPTRPDRRRIVASVPWPPGTFNREFLANARLIAAAPELLGACRSALRYIGRLARRVKPDDYSLLASSFAADDPGVMRRLLGDVIAKAEGKGDAPQ
jgi:hypothetical protein